MKNVDNRELCKQIANHAIEDNFMDAEVALKKAVGSYVANKIANNIVDIRKQELKK